MKHTATAYKIKCPECGYVHSGFLFYDHEMVDCITCGDSSFIGSLRLNGNILKKIDVFSDKLNWEDMNV